MDTAHGNFSTETLTALVQQAVAAALDQPKKPACVPVADLPGHFEYWMMTGRAKRRSPETMAKRETVFANFMWWLQRPPAPIENVDPLVIDRFLAYLSEDDPDGKWRAPNQRNRAGQLMKPVTEAAKPRTVRTYYAHLHAFFRLLEKKDLIARSPMASSEAPPEPQGDTIETFDGDMILRMITAANKSKYPLRDIALIWLFFDTGLRRAEIAGINISDINWKEWSLSVMGKGQKRRTIGFGQQVYEDLWKYVRNEKRPANTPLFVAHQGTRHGQRISGNGLYQTVVRVGMRAGINPDAVRCSPHTFRHTFALNALLNGAHERGLMTMLGHTTRRMTDRYTNIRDSDVLNLHRIISPADNLLSREKPRP